MSIRLMSIAWKAPDLNPGQKLVLIALCDNASDEGACFPYVRTLAAKCSMGERTIQGHLADFEARGFITRDERPGRSTVYTIHPRSFCAPLEPAPPAGSAPHPAESAPTPNNEEPSPNGQGALPDKKVKKPREKREETTLKTWLETIKAKGEMALPPEHEVFAYAEKIKLPEEFIVLAWKVFKKEYTTDAKLKLKRYALWRVHFLKAIKGNWLRLWWVDPQGAYLLNTKGLQAKVEHAEPEEVAA